MSLNNLYDLYRNNQRTIDTLIEQNNNIMNQITNLQNNQRNRHLPTNNSPLIGLLVRSFLEQPITPQNHIIPSNEQIQNATETILYSSITEPINTSCPISLENFTSTSNVTMIKQCKHLFNPQSLTQWFVSNCVCPICRYDIRNYNSQESNDGYTYFS